MDADGNSSRGGGSCQTSTAAAAAVITVNDVGDAEGHVTLSAVARRIASLHVTSSDNPDGNGDMSSHPHHQLVQAHISDKVFKSLQQEGVQGILEPI